MPTFVAELYGSRHLGDETVMYGLDGNDQLYFTGLTSVSLYGGAGIDLLEAGPANDHLEGGEGSDILHGRGGNDVLYGGDGNDAGLYYPEPTQRYELGLLARMVTITSMAGVAQTFLSVEPVTMF